MTDSDKETNGFLRSSNDRLDHEIENIEVLLFLPENEWSDEVKKLKSFLDCFSSKTMGMNERYLLDFYISRKTGMSKAKIEKLGLPKRKGRNEARDTEICAWCNAIGTIETPEGKRIEGKGWHSDEGGVYYIIAKKYGIAPSTIQGIYDSPKNAINWKVKK